MNSVGILVHQKLGTLLKNVSSGSIAEMLAPLHPSEIQSRGIAFWTQIPEPRHGPGPTPPSAGAGRWKPLSRAGSFLSDFSLAMHIQDVIHRGE
jgi:hypothetical protein